MEKKSFNLTLTVAVLISLGGAFAAQPTHVVVHVRAKDAKFVGTSMGGALITIRDSDTGEVLAQGVTRGTTGDTQTLMKTPHARGTQLSDDAAAKFDAVVDLEEPRLVTVEAKGPLAQRQSAVTVSTQVWLIPGKDIPGDGILLELPGFAVDLLSPQTHESIKLVNNEATLAITANVVMMCGCPVTVGGLWDAKKYEVKALVKHGETFVGEIPLAATGKASTFRGELQVSETGVYEIIVYAYDAGSGNTGVDKTTVVITR